MQKRFFYGRPSTRVLETQPENMTTQSKMHATFASGERLLAPQ